MKRVTTRSLGAILSDFVEESRLSDGLLQTRITAAWDSLTLDGTDLREYTAQRSFRDGVLSCRIRSSVIRSHLQLQESSLRRQLNARLGDELVRQIKFS